MLPFLCWLTGCVLDDPVFCQKNHRKQKYKNGVAFDLVSPPPLLLPILLTLWWTTVTICLWANQPEAIVLHSPVQQHHLLPAPCPITSGKHLFHHLTLIPWHPVIDWLAIDNLAKDFQLEPVQKANLHAFSGVGSLSCSTCVQLLYQIGMMDGILVKSDLLTCIYILASIYADITECHHQYNNQEFTDLKGLFNDLKIHLKNTFVLTPQQLVHTNLYYQYNVWHYSRQISARLPTILFRSTTILTSQQCTPTSLWVLFTVIEKKVPNIFQ